MDINKAAAEKICLIFVLKFFFFGKRERKYGFFECFRFPLNGYLFAFN